MVLSGVSIVLFGLMMASCGNTRQLTYMQGKFDTAQLSRIALQEPVIRKGDLLSIVVYSDNPAATALFNQVQTGGSGNGGTSIPSSGSSGGQGGVSASSSGSTGGSPATGGYLVDDRGNIEFQGLGSIHVDSMSKSELKDTLNVRLKQFLSNPFVSVRFLNYKFTMLGEISRPGIYNIPGEHINLLEAIGLGGDLTFYGRRDNILIVRELNGKRTFSRLDLTKPEIMTSPYFNLQPNDVVYIEANRKKVAANDQTFYRTVTITTSIVSMLAIIITLFRNN